MEPKAKERLYALIERVPASEIHAVERFLEYVAVVGDPFLRALESAPTDDEPLSDQDRKALEEARAELDRGDRVSDAELGAELGL